MRRNEIEEVYDGVSDFLVSHVKLGKQRQEGGKVGRWCRVGLLRAQSIFDCAEHDSGLYIKSEAVIQSKYVVTHLLHALQLGLRPDLVESLSQRHGRHDVCTSKNLFSLFAQTSEKLHLLRPTFFIDKCTDIAGRDPRQAFYCGKKSILARSTTLTSHLDLVSSRVCSVFFLYAFSSGF